MPEIFPRYPAVTASSKAESKAQVGFIVSQVLYISFARNHMFMYNLIHHKQRHIDQTIDILSMIKHVRTYEYISTKLQGRSRCNVIQNTVNWLTLPYEIWLEILTCCDLAAKDLLHLELTCTYFKGIKTPKVCAFGYIHVTL